MRKKLSFAITAVLLLISFNISGQTVSAKKPVKPKSPVAPVVSAAEIAEGKQLIAKSDCMACHKLDVKIVGPAYKEVAKKYVATPANYTLLAKKIIKGGGGVWGQISMTAHPGLTEAEASKMVKYILSLR